MMKPTAALILFTLFLAACGLLNVYESNGERIYFTGTNENGRRIAYTGGPSGGMMMNRDLSCASCHSDDGRGGPHTMHMQQMDAPDIRFQALNGHATEDGHDHGETYTLKQFRLAVIEGRHPDGTLMHTDMPRWSLTEADLADVFAFIQTLE